jgi:cGMP-dependent protein kinase
MTPQDAQFLFQSLSHHFIFTSLVHSSLNQLLPAFFYCKAEPGQMIIRQGDGASSFFVVHRGRVEIVVNGECKRQIGVGVGFGDLALLYDAPRSASCRAVEACEMFGINRVEFRRAIKEINSSTYL